MNEAELPSYSESAALGDLGVDLVSKTVNRALGWITRPQPKADVGIDAHIEIVDHGRATGRLLGVQIKCGESFFAETSDTRFVFRPAAKHANYWRRFPLPVVVVLCDPRSELCYWQVVDDVTLRSTGRSFRIDVPSSQLIDSAAGDQLRALAPRQQVMEGLLDVCLIAFLAEKYSRELAICPTAETPRDYHWFQLLAEIAGELTSVTWTWTPEHPVDMDLLDKVRHWRAYNDRNACQVSRVLLCAIGPRGNPPPIPDEVRASAADDEPPIDIVRLVHDPNDAWSMQEIDDDNAVLMWLPSAGTVFRYPQDE